MKLNVSNISVSYDESKILNNISFDAEEGEFVSIIGPSGCGKSTLLNILAGLLPKESGSVHVDNEQINGMTPHFAYMPQDDLLMPWKTVLDNVCLHASINGEKDKAIKKAMENMDKFGLSGYENKYPAQLSGGMRQRAAFLRTSLCPADIILLDEPFASLDVITKENMQDWLIHMRGLLSRTMLLVTHDIDEAIYLSDRILILAGRPAGIVQEIVLPEKTRDRQWLFEQSEIKSRVYRILREAA